ncbi:class I SAM-dependent methyltransferase [Thalassotalea ponticola]|uniref:class I SAM-dependent methyltransferase n=1 Tax=Thalassotalea ponticola TaxID=1523392 RepID=UPI0025B3AB9B|nr:class I SAM-dependent methyltransferase [Thalassotalea ponticola]MDN3652943.1 class I SAM-dependent methyltransferase [Thalassotalea ponticola]
MKAEGVSERWQLPYAGELRDISKVKSPYYLLVSDDHVALHKTDEPKLGGIHVDFVGGAAGHRRKFGGGRGQDIAKAVGLKHGFNPHVLDATAGLGRDAFVLANLGCRLTMIERQQPVAALLDDGLRRAQQDEELGAWISERMQLIHASSIDAMASEQALADIDVVYLDPMYPHREKSAAVKKEMRVFQGLVGSDPDADQLLDKALAIAKYRVVVKRPNYAEPLAGRKPSTSIKMKKNRFDIYVVQGLPKS